MDQNILKEKNFSKLKEKLTKEKIILLFLDYDGTLSNFKKNPKKAYPVKGIKKIIKQLSKINFVKITIISGRNLKDLKNMIKLNNIYYAGLHGLEMKDYKPPKLNSKKIQYYKNIIQKKYQKEIKNDDLYLEDKKFVLSIHYRDCYKNINKLKSFINNLINKNKYEMMEGRKILEIRPNDWDKGKAVKMIRKSSFKNYKKFEIYIGDDTTDEDAFEIINGFSIYVKNNTKMSKKADFSLANPDEVLIFLKKLNKFLKTK